MEYSFIFLLEILECPHNPILCECPHNPIPNVEKISPMGKMVVDLIPMAMAPNVV
jgi:hypothetical protein